MPISTNPSQMIGRSIWLSNNSPWRDNWSSNPSYSFQNAHLSISLRPKRKKITSNCTLEEFSSWTIARTSFQSISISLEVSSTQRIYHLTSPENSCNTIKFSRSLRKTSSKNALNSSQKSMKTQKISRSSMNNSAKISNWVFMRTLLTELNSLSIYAISHQRVERNKPH
jgi:hypothetical protein